jgi:hypothetical protein
VRKPRSSATSDVEAPGGAECDNPEANHALAGVPMRASVRWLNHHGVMNPDWPAESVPERLTAPACVTFVEQSYAHRDEDDGGEWPPGGESGWV